MKTKKINMRSYRMKEINARVYSQSSVISVLSDSLLQSNESNEYWFNVKFTKGKKEDSEYFKLTYSNQRNNLYFNFDPPFPINAKYSDINKIITKEYDEDGSWDNTTTYYYNNEIVTLAPIQSGALNYQLDNIIDLPCRIIIYVETPDSDDVVDYFYVDVDVDQNVKLSK